MANGSLHTLRISGSDSALVLRQIGKMHDARMVHYVESQALDPVREKKRYRRRRVLHGAAGRIWKSLENNENRMQHMQHTFAQRSNGAKAISVCKSGI